MNYIKQINQFYRILPNNPLSSNAQCLYNYLLNKNSELGWIKEFTIANSIVMGFTSLNISALQRTRNELKTKGYIDYKKGSGNNAGTYRIIEFEQQYEQQSEQQYEQQTDSNVNNNMHTLNKINKTKINKTNSMQYAIDFYENNINLITPFEFEKLQDYSDMEAEVIVLAIQKAIRANKRTFNYIDGILKKWKAKGIRTVIQVKNEELEFRQARQPKEETEEEKMARKIRELEEATANDTK